MAVVAGQDLAPVQWPGKTWRRCTGAGSYLPAHRAISNQALPGEFRWEARHVTLLYTLAYPSLSAADADRIEAFRRLHDPQHDIVAAHFTLVFACGEVVERTYVEHVASVSRMFSPISFSCRYAMLGTDEAARGYAYLVPDEGYSGISRLHDALYGGLLADHLRLDIPFVPHMSLASSTDRPAAKRLCDELNAAGVQIHGSIERLSVAALRDGRICKLAEFSLGCLDS